MPRTRSILNNLTTLTLPKNRVNQTPMSTLGTEKPHLNVPGSAERRFHRRDGTHSVSNLHGRGRGDAGILYPHNPQSQLF